MRIGIRSMRTFVALALVGSCVVVLLSASSCNSPHWVASDSYIDVWETVNEEYFDPHFGGLDWQAQFDKYGPKTMACDNAADFAEVTNELLFKLGVSHLMVFAPDELEQASPELTARGTAGMDLRLIAGEMVVSSVTSGGPADRSGIHPGDILLEIDGREVEQLLNEALTELTPPYNAAAGQTAELRRRLYGTPGDLVSVSLRASDGSVRVHNLQYAERTGSYFAATGMPEFFAESEAKHLTDVVGYLRISYLLQAVVLNESQLAIRDMSDMPGLIIDLRGNGGGHLTAAITIAESLVPERTLVWRVEERDGVDDMYIEPKWLTYNGEVVFLVDELTGSGAEELAGGMQAIGRAAVIGKTTRGADMHAQMKTLPNGCVLIYPVGRPLLADGAIIEGQGITPDINVELDPKQLSRGIDNQLEAAIDFLQSKLGD